MAGNAREWVQDLSAPYSGSAQTDPIGPDSGYVNRVIRGGCWKDKVQPRWFAPYRSYAAPHGASRLVGIRVAK